MWHRRAIVLTTTGRKSGLPRTVLVQVFDDGSDLYVVAANSGLARPPGWYFNVRADPRIVGELDGTRLELRADMLSGAEAMTRWHGVVLPAAPDYEKYERRRGSIPPIFRLVRVDHQPS
jgi:deazaflavin-dependent oxidoreductase (nitroreductase family)